ncbi:CBS domain containing-hemolysin-like protein [Bacillus sp. SORGH_AS 510]|uniref:hypothetical protein n=1 Tax=Bacillus sp. SORGH_AS_0510 TaxID=3041771 RepID=UPI00277F56D2|nr:hypothetical protein [Bacillus sp. SORGH_AS_0510]MDQ1143606.1 CBS domain containing-hemolysin-like protein [Bacillus sp. SORGH_AS_0510]
MFAVHFLENKNVLLTQLLRRVPEEGEAIKIKGRKGTVAKVTNVDEKNIQVQVVLEKVNKNKQAALDPSKKKRR